MNWDNKTVLKFLELYQINSCIWDPQHESHKNRQCVNDAWSNIKENLGLSCSIKDLKKKKESLMSAYRNYKTKIRKSERSGSGFGDVYQPTWFAFSFMDGFLGSVYTCKTSRSTEDEEVIEDTAITRTIITTDEPNESIIESKPTILQYQESSSITPIPPVRRQKNPRELIEAKQHNMGNAFNFMKRVAQERQHPKNEDDECSIFGQLIARKIRKLSEERRDIMMVKINQLFVDEHILNRDNDKVKD
ncbi:uncharacterized protein LOC121726764 [Aricia agestis]|uniref:uncharacterized protein LOC121726764 n=1 Tax=Aricia agestis TaxID=91739 RepID=UPI001C201961|nr:uncharacterized protein LOC121726764 [Aricia agestis]